MRFVFSCFNSTLVQLKVNTDGILNAASKSFNSTLVQLKVALPTYSGAIFPFDFAANATLRKHCGIVVG